MRGEAGAGRLRHRVGEAVARHRLWSRGDRVAVAVSGGLDSVCLLDLLLETRDWHGGRLEVVTVDHGIHPGSADHAAFVAELAEARGLSCAVVRAALGPGASEAVARDARYAAFEALPVARIALAHHRDDQAETLLLQLLRGSGARGLGAMARRRDRYVRPLLDVTRAELVRWAEHRRLSWVDDPTNASDRYLRNRVRREVLPLLEALRPGAAGALARAASHCAEDDAALDELAVSCDPTDRAWVASGPPALVGRALRRRWPELEASHVEAVVGCARRGSGAVQLGNGRVVEVDGARIVARNSVAEEDNP